MSERIFIVSLMRTSGDTGVQAHVNSFYNFLVAHGVPVERVTPYDRGMWIWYPLYALRYVIQLCHRPTSVRWYRYVRLLALMFRLRKLLGSQTPAVLYAQCPVSADACLRARRAASHRVTMVAHFNISQADEWVGQGYLQSGDRAWRTIRNQEIAVLPKLDAIVFVSAFMRDLVLQRIPAIDKARCRVIPNFVRAPQSPSTQPYRAEGKITLVSVGTLEPRKNQGYLLDIMAIARREIPGLTLTLIGDGPDRQLLEQRAHALELDTCVNFMGKVSGAADMLPQFDGYIHASQIENLPISIIEAMAAGLPIFACPVGGIPELFTDGQEGHFLPLDNALAAAQILSNALKSKDHFEKLGREAQARFQTDFDQRVVAQDLLDFLLSDASHEPGAACNIQVHTSGFPKGVEQSGPKLFWLLRRTSLLTQTLHSGTSFLLMAGMARLAPSYAFALAAAFFLLVTLISSLNIYVLSAAWLRAEGPEAMRRLEGFTLFLTLTLGLIFALFWVGYRGWAFGPAALQEVLLVGVAAFSYLFFFARRRQLLLDGQFGVATLADGLRSVLVIVGAVATMWGGWQFDFSQFLWIFVLAHLLGVVPVLTRGSINKAPSSEGLGWWQRLQRSLSPLQAITHADWLSVGSGLANVMFSQSASLLAPMLIDPAQYATLRAYELFLFPVFFMAQVLDPIYMREFRLQTGDAQNPTLPQRLGRPALLIFTPLTLICLGVWLSPWLATLFQTLIAVEYRSAFWLLGLVLALSGLISFNAPVRWYLTVAGEGKPLLFGTGVGIVLSLMTLLVLTHWQPLAWTVLAAKMMYEVSLALAGAVGVVRLKRAR